MNAISAYADADNQNRLSICIQEGEKKQNIYFPMQCHTAIPMFFLTRQWGEFTTLIDSTRPLPTIASPGCLLLAKVFKMPGMRVVLTISKPTVLRVGLISNVAWASNLATAYPGPYLVSDATGQVSTENAQCDYCIAMSSSSSSSTATLRTMVHIHDDPLVGIYNGYG